MARASLARGFFRITRHITCGQETVRECRSKTSWYVSRPSRAHSRQPKHIMHQQNSSGLQSSRPATRPHRLVLFDSNSMVILYALYRQASPAWLAESLLPDYCKAVQMPSPDYLPRIPTRSVQPSFCRGASIILAFSMFGQVSSIDKVSRQSDQRTHT